MSLRLRLILLTVALVTVVVVVLSALYLNSLMDSLSATALERSELASQQVNAFITDRINRHSGEYQFPVGAPAGTVEQTKSLWRDIVSSDQEISALLVRTMALSPALVEINIAGEDGVILASSNPGRVGEMIKQLQNFAVWRNRPLNQRLTDVLVRKPDYQVVVPLGISGGEPIFTIQVATSAVLLRAAVLPEVRTVSLVAASALLASLLLTGMVASRALRPLKRIERTIDRIAQGQHAGEETGQHAVAPPPTEFAAVETKLNLLGEQYTGARQESTALKHSLDEMVERMASQLDVASRFAAISRISGGVAHEIKNPLNSISLRLDLLRARAEASDPDLIPEIDVLSKEVRRLDRVVKTFLDFSRPVEVKFVEVDLGALAAEVAQLMTPQARLAGIQLEYQSPENPALLRGDEDMLKQATLNIVTNALEAMKQGGSLQLAVSQNSENVVLEIADTGPGIPAEVRDKVFQLYFTTKERGSGIGLAMTYRAVQLHNGTVEFQTESGHGTTFRLQFPAVSRHA